MTQPTHSTDSCFFNCMTDALAFMLEATHQGSPCMITKHSDDDIQVDLYETIEQ